MGLLAIQVKPYTRLSAGGSLVFESFLEYDDADYQTLNDDGEHDDFRIVRFFGTNHSEHPVTVSTFKANGGVQWTRTLPAGEDFSVNAGGSVKYESDIPVWRYR